MIRAIRAAAFLASLSFVAVCSSTAGAQQAGPAAATNARCGGVLCDLYYRDVPEGAPIPPSMTAMTALPCHDFVCGMFGGRTPDQPRAEQVSAMPEPAAEPVKSFKRKKHIAKAKVAKAKTDPAPTAAK